MHIIESGNVAAATGVKLSRAQVIAAYPITPQTPLTEKLSEFVESGKLKAEYIPVESEHSAMAVCIAASTAGTRAFTATSANGLLYMVEQLHWAVGARLPIVMCVANRGIGAPWTVWNDQQDTISQRDVGWIQIYANDHQQIIDSVIKAFRLAQTVSIPVMVCYDGYLLSHTYMPFDQPEQDKVDSFLPSFTPKHFLDPENPGNFNTVTLPDIRPGVDGQIEPGYIEIRHNLQEDLRAAIDTYVEIDTEFEKEFGRGGNPLVEKYRCDDADFVAVCIGSLSYQLRDVIDTMRDKDIKIGVMGVQMYRPFPDAAIVDALVGKKCAIIFEKALSYGNQGALYADIKSALYTSDKRPLVHNYIIGLGGREIKTQHLLDALTESCTYPERIEDTPVDRFKTLEKTIMENQTTILNLTEEEFVHPGNRACSGCGLSIVYRIGLKALGKNTILVVPPSCLTVLQGLYPVASTKLPCVNVTFASTGAAATGVRAAMRALNKANVNVVAWAGDGGTSDIGIQALSGACERGEDIIYICYDNEAYMNTGVQRSGTTPQGVLTTTTPIKGKLQEKKDVPSIIAAHGIGYVATASAAYPLDFHDKVRKATTISGPKYIHVHTPCPPGWSFETRYTIKVGKLAVQTGLFDLYEIENGEFRLTGASKNLIGKERLPVTEYFKTQGRFKSLDKDIIAKVQKQVDAKWAGY